jgi:hypothetical protein
MSIYQGVVARNNRELDLRYNGPRPPTVSAEMPRCPVVYSFEECDAMIEHFRQHFLKHGDTRSQQIMRAWEERKARDIAAAELAARSGAGANHD